MSHSLTRPVGVILFGLGSLGSLVVRCLSSGYPLIRVVGAVDHDARLAGRSLASIYPDFADAGSVIVRATLAQALADSPGEAKILYHLTESDPVRIEGQLTEALAAGLNVISASEAMFYPHLRHSDFAKRIDETARNAGVSVSGVGINPGFSFDAVPLALARATCGVERITITRAIDVTGTGPGDIEHVGYGLSPADFQQKIASGQIVGHMGMPESIVKLAEHLGIEIDRIEEGWETETADFPIDSGTETLGMIPPGHVVGITQSGIALRAGQAIITMRLIMYYQPERFGIECADTIDIEGQHHIQAALRPAALSLFGAANTIVNATADVVAASPGFVSILDASTAGHPRSEWRYGVEMARAGSMTLRRYQAPAA
jgi:2,4-diaminopentanoate dehydrogenase